MPSYGSIGELPYMAVGNDELGDELESTHKCPNCHKRHIVNGGPLDTVLCPKDNNYYVVGVGGRKIADT
jgi:hypothetical protein